MTALLAPVYDARMSARCFPRSAAVAVLLLFAALSLLASDHPKKLVGQWKGETYAKGQTRAEYREGADAARHHTLELSLGPDGTATVMQSPDAVSEMTSFAHWTMSGDQLKLIFDADPGHPEQPAQAPMAFTMSHGELSPVTWDHSLWKAQVPPSLHRE